MNRQDMACWQGVSADLIFTPNDFDILDLTISLIPELRLCAYILKRARLVHIQYPITGIEALLPILEKGRLVACGHHIEEDAIRTYMPTQFFPINHEGELISRVYIALQRCKEDVSLARRIDPKTYERLSRLRFNETGDPS